MLAASRASREPGSIKLEGQPQLSSPPVGRLKEFMTDDCHLLCIHLIVFHSLLIEYLFTQFHLPSCSRRLAALDMMRNPLQDPSLWETIEAAKKEFFASDASISGSSPKEKQQKFEDGLLQLSRLPTLPQVKRRRLVSFFHTPCGQALRVV